jgi:hypothetical protein
MKNLRAQIAQSRPILVFAALALAAAIAPVVAVALMALPQVRKDLLAALDLLVAENPARWIWALVVAPIVGFAVAHPAPPDDLLRNLVSGVYGFDYRKAFWGSPRVSSGDYYAGFDWVASQTYAAFQRVGLQRWSWLPFSSALAVGFAGVLPAVLLAQTTRRDLPTMLAIVVLACTVWAIAPFAGRIPSGRPEAFLALWGLTALLVRKRWQLGVWTLLGCFLGGAYWLSAVYFAAVALVRRPLSEKIAAGAVLAAVFLTTWFVLSDGHYVAWLWNLHVAVQHRVGSVAEDLPIGIGMLGPAGVSLITLLVAALSLRENQRPAWRTEFGWLLLVVGWFLLPDMLRYFDVLGPLLAVLILRAVGPRIPETLPHWAARSGATLGAGLLLMLALNGFKARPLLDLHIPGAKPGDKVLTYFSSVTYDTLFLNPGVRVAPAMEMGMTRRDVQLASFDMAQGKVNCPWLIQNDVRWVVDLKTLWDAKHAPQCLSLIRLLPTGESIWHVDRREGGAP